MVALCLPAAHVLMAVMNGERPVWAAPAEAQLPALYELYKRWVTQKGSISMPACFAVQGAQACHRDWLHSVP
jgi:hypothetical protein